MGVVLDVDVPACVPLASSLYFDYDAFWRIYGRSIHALDQRTWGVCNCSHLLGGGSPADGCADVMAESPYDDQRCAVLKEAAQGVLHLTQDTSEHLIG
jgi:hypothetical protein